MTPFGQASLMSYAIYGAIFYNFSVLLPLVPHIGDSYALGEKLMII